MEEVADLASLETGDEYMAKFMSWTFSYIMNLFFYEPILQG